MTRYMFGAVLLSAMAACLLSPDGLACPVVAFCDDFNRATFDASSNGWIIQSYPKGKGTFGRTPGMIENNQKARYAVRVYPDGFVHETNTATSQKFTPFTSNNPNSYIEFSTSVKLNWSTANTDGLVFGISAYGNDTNGADAVNFEFVTKQINGGSNGVVYDRLLLSSFNDFDSSVNDNRWFGYYESGVNATNGYHVYTMKLFYNKVEYLVDGSVIATNNGPHVPTANLSFVLNAWAPDSSWQSAEGPLPNDSYYYMDVDWAKVAYRSGGAAVPEPSSLFMLLSLAGLMLGVRSWI